MVALLLTHGCELHAPVDELAPSPTPAREGASPFPSAALAHPHAAVPRIASEAPSLLRTVLLADSSGIPANVHAWPLANRY